MPDPTTDSVGTNYIGREEKIIYFILTGEAFVEIRTSPVIIVSYTLPAMTIDEFFGVNLVNNIASFLNVAASQVRIVEIVNAQSSGRKKRSTEGTTVVVEIGDEPGDSTPLTYSEIQALETSISNGVALGTMDVLPNDTVALSIGLITATPPVESNEWAQVSVDDEPYILNKAGNMAPHEAPVPGRERMTFDTPARLRIYDDASNPLSIVGSVSDPWRVAATLSFGAGSNQNATLQGTTTVSFSGGWANFTDLVISLPGSDYAILFIIVSPNDAANFTCNVTSLTVLARVVTTTLVSTTIDPLEDAAISMTLELRDESTGSAMSDIAWRGHTWNVTASLTDGSFLNGTLTTAFNPSSGRAYFTDLSIPEIGRYYLSFDIRSTPDEYSFTIESYVDVTTTALQNLVVQKSSTCQFSFNTPYDVIQSAKDAANFANIWAIKNKNNGVRVTGVSASPGSVLVTITFEGLSGNVTSMISDLCAEVQTGTTLYSFGGTNISMTQYMSIDGQAYYGNSCDSKNTSGQLELWILVTIIVLSIAIVVLIVGILVWKFAVHPKSKTSTVANTFSHLKYLGHVDTPWQAEQFMTKDMSYPHLKSQMIAPVAPADTVATHSFNQSNMFDLYVDRPHSKNSSGKLPLPAD